MYANHPLTKPINYPPAEYDMRQTQPPVSRVCCPHHDSIDGCSRTAEVPYIACVPQRYPKCPKHNIPMLLTFVSPDGFKWFKDNKIDITKFLIGDPPAKHKHGRNGLRRVR